MIPSRYLEILGRCSPDARGQVVIDDDVVHDGAFPDWVLYGYNNPVSWHGKIHHRIYMESGSISIEKVQVTYPAIFNDQIPGHPTFVLPQMVLRLSFDEALDLPKQITQSAMFDHLVLNGPNCFSVKTDVIPPGKRIQVPMTSLRNDPNIKMVYKYPRLKCSGLVHDFQKLNQLVYGKISQW